MKVKSLEKNSVLNFMFDFIVILKKYLSTKPVLILNRLFFLNYIHAYTTMASFRTFVQSG
jgi:hypothetical protein